MMPISSMFDYLLAEDKYIEDVTICKNMKNNKITVNANFLCWSSHETFASYLFEDVEGLLVQFIYDEFVLGGVEEDKIRVTEV